jgi:hypothetical protein
VNPRGDYAPPIPGSLIGLLVLVAGILIAGAVLFAFSGFERFQTDARGGILRELSASIPPQTGQQRLFFGTGGFERCDEVVYFEVYATRSEFAAVREAYARTFLQRGWPEVQGGAFYANPITRLELIERVPQAIAGVTIPGNVFAAQATATLYALVFRTWDGTLCPERNLSAQVIRREG